MNSFAIVVVCYNRVDGLRSLVNSLEMADYDGRNDITLIFSIDNSGKDDVLRFAEAYNWKYGNKIIRTFAERQGLRNHILACGDYTDQYDIVVVLEDDIWVSDSFYHYAYQASNKYESDERIAGISLYSFQKNWLFWALRFEPIKTEWDSFFMRIAQSWGQVWTKNKWKPFKDWYLNNIDFSYSNAIPDSLFKWPKSSWLKYHTRYCIETNRFFVYPYYALSSNTGHAGEHSLIGSSEYQVELQVGKRIYNFPDYSTEAIKYDEYMNPMNLGKYIGVDDAELTIDLYGTRSSFPTRFILTTQILNYEVVKEFSLSFHPIEYSVVNDIIGKGIYLYNKDKPCKNKARENTRQELLFFSSRTRHLPSTYGIFIYSLKRLIKSKMGWMK